MISTIALTNATLRHGLMIADLGLEQAVSKDTLLAQGVNCYDVHITCKEVADGFGMEYRDINELI